MNCTTFRYSHRVFIIAFRESKPNGFWLKNGIFLRRWLQTNVRIADRPWLSLGRLFTLLALLFSCAVNAQEAVTQLARFATTEAGIHRVSYEDLLEQGIDLQGYDHVNFGLSSQGQSVQIRSRGQSNVNSIQEDEGFGQGGFIEFYAEKSDDRYDSRRVYTLTLGGAVPQMQLFEAEIQSAKGKKHRSKGKKHRSKGKKHGSKGSKRSKGSKGSKVSKGAPSPSDLIISTYLDTQIIEQNNYYDFLAPSNTDPWHFGQVISRAGIPANGQQLLFELDGLVDTAIQISVELYGLSDANRLGDDHQVGVSVNDFTVADVLLDGQARHTIQIADVPVQAGLNEFGFVLNSAPDAVFSAIGLNRLIMSYSRNAQSAEGYLEGVFEDNIIVVDGFFIDEEVRAYRRNEDGTYTYFDNIARSDTLAVLPTEQGPAHYVFAAENGLKKAQILPMDFTKNITTGSAEYLIIAHPKFIGSELDRLVQLKELEYTTKVVSVQEIYNQFGEQIPSADAIHDYIRFATSNLGTEFVALIGSDTYDYKGVQSYNETVTSYLPTLYRDAKVSALHIYQVQSDAAYGDVDGDQVPDIPVGRFPVQTLQDLDNMVSKLEQYEIASPFTFTTLMADSGFEGDAESWTNSLPDGSRMKGQLKNRFWEDFRAYVDSDGPAEAHSEVIQSLNLGVVAVNYFGHGSMSQLGSASPALLAANDTQFLTNTASPFVFMQWSSWTGSFANADSGNNLMYNLLTADRTGAATLTGLSSLTSRVNANRLARELSFSLYQQNATLGESLIQAKRAISVDDFDSVKDVVLGMQIIGDPSIIVNWWPN